MNRRSTDILVAGGGLAGLIAAAAFASAGHRIVLVEPGYPVTEANQDGADLRSTAFLLPAQNLFERIGLWPVLEPHAVALETLRIVDTTGSPSHLRGERDALPRRHGPRRGVLIHVAGHEISEIAEVGGLFHLTPHAYAQLVIELDVHAAAVHAIGRGAAVCNNWVYNCAAGTFDPVVDPARIGFTAQPARGNRRRGGSRERAPRFPV